MPELTVQPRIKTYVPKAPTQRAYTPKATDPGQRITWSRSISYASTETRIGTIWSAGALPSSVWVQPDDAASGDMVLVLLRSMTEHASYPATWQHDTIKRCEHLRQAAGMLAEYRTVAERSWGYRSGSGATERELVECYHCDPACPEISLSTRPAPELTTGYLIRMMLDATARGRSDLCRRCVYLSEPAEVTAAA